MTSYTSITNRKLRFGIVGCGRISQKHIEAIRLFQDDIEISAVCDPVDERLSTAINLTGAKGYKNYSDLLLTSDVDAVVLATPSGLHSRQAIQAAHAGKHVITEKPMATRWSDGIAMVKACDANNVRLFVVKQNRRNPTIDKLKKLLQDKKLGKVYLVNINVLWARSQAYYDSADWRGTWEFDGGALMNQASHYVDFVDWLIGPVESVHAYTATLGRNIDVEDTAVMNIRWRSGALGSLNVTMLTYGQNFEGSITIIAEKGTVRLGGVAVNEYLYWNLEEADDKLSIQSTNYDVSSVYGNGHSLYYENVLKVLRGNAEPETDGREGLKSLEVLIAAYLSARNGERIGLPLEY
jgi:UDP-N-acetyl-2-amino-2-deoxyglucuronate dehydrogenase